MSWEIKPMDPAVLVGIIGVLLSGATFYLGRRFERRIRQQDKSEQRINDFVADYVDRARRHINTGITALTPAGVFRLASDSEIRAGLEICAKQLGKHPLGNNQELLASTDLKKFFDFVASHKINFATTSVEDALRRMEGRG